MIFPHSNDLELDLDSDLEMDGDLSRLEITFLDFLEVKSGDLDHDLDTD